MEIVPYGQHYNVLDGALISLPNDNVEREAAAGYEAAINMLGTKAKLPDHGVLKAYGALAEGREVISLNLTMAHAGLVSWLNPSERRYTFPRLAIAPVYAKKIKCKCGDGGVSFKTKGWRLELPAWNGLEGYRTSVGTINVPFIPARVHLDNPKQLFILWETSQLDWKNTRGGVRPVGDPALLEHIAGNVYSVVTTWDLTPLEKAVLGG